MMKSATWHNIKRCQFPGDGPGPLRRIKSRYSVLFCLPFACSVLATDPDILFMGTRRCGEGMTNISCPADQLLIGLRYDFRYYAARRLDELEPECAGYDPSNGRWLEISAPDESALQYHVRCPEHSYAYGATAGVFALVDSVFLRCISPGASTVLKGAGTEAGSNTDLETCPEGQVMSSLGYIEADPQISEGFCAVWFNCRPFHVPISTEASSPVTDRYAEPVIANTRNSTSSDIAFSPDRQMLLSVEDHNVIVWDLNLSPVFSVTIKALLPVTADVKYLSFTPDSKTMVTLTDDLALRYWSLQEILSSGRPDLRAEISFPEQPLGAGFSHDGWLVVYGHSATEVFDRWDAATQEDAPKKLFSIPATDPVRLARFVAGTHQLLTGRHQSEVNFWDLDQPRLSDGVRTGTLKAVVRMASENTFNDRAQFLALSPDQQLLAAIGPRGQGNVWRTSESFLDHQGLPRYSLLARIPRAVSHLSFCAGGKYLVSLSSVTHYATLWSTGAVEADPLSNVPALKQVAVLPYGAALVRVVCHSGDRNLVVTVSEDGNMTLWDLDNISEQNGFPVPEALVNMHHDASVVKILFHSDGRHIMSLSADGHWFVWDIAEFVRKD